MNSNSMTSVTYQLNSMIAPMTLKGKTSFVVISTIRLSDPNWNGKIYLSDGERLYKRGVCTSVLRLDKEDILDKYACNCGLPKVDVEAYFEKRNATEAYVYLCFDGEDIDILLDDMDSIRNKSTRGFEYFYDTL